MTTEQLRDQSKQAREELGRQFAAGAWTNVGVGVEGDRVLVSGINPWDYEWESLEVNVKLPHPSYPSQLHDIRVWRVATIDRTIYFAAGELSMNVWGFYVPAS